MPQRPLLRRALGRVDQLLHAARHPAPPPPGPERAVAPPASSHGPLPAVERAAGTTEEPGAGAPPLDPRHAEGLAMAGRQQWGRAQRALEAVVRERPEGPAADDLASVRAARRQLRVLQKWPRDAQAHLALGRAYFELGLGEEAEQAYRRAIALAPDEPAAHYLLTLEYLYRGATDEAEETYARARALTDGLPPFAELLVELAGLPGDCPRPPG